MLENESTRNTHNLKEDSPALNRAFELLYEQGPDEAMPGLRAAYRLACEGNAKSESGFTRKEGVSYNPRVARCPLILCNYTQENSWLTLAACMLACAEALPSPDHTYGQELKPPTDLAHEAQALLKADLLPEEFREQALAIALALTLDDIRHLHQREENNDKWLKSFISRCESLHGEGTKKLIGNRFTRLLTIYRKSLDRYSTRS